MNIEVSDNNEQERQNDLLGEVSNHPGEEVWGDGVSVALPFPDEDGPLTIENFQSTKGGRQTYTHA